MNKFKNIDELSVATIRSYIIDCINKAKSGHPGTSLDSSAILYTLYKDFFVSNPNDPNWINRDRFILSSGHASMLLYIILHLCGYKISENDLQNFRQLGSITTGHPEVNVTDGVDCSTGPLGQGLANSVGFAMAEEILRNKYGKDLINHYTYCLCGDGCLEEGVSQEAIQYAGLQKLSHLIWLYDRNSVTLDGPLSQSSIENTKLRFKANNWNVILCNDGNNISKVSKALKKARNLNNGKPTVIIFDCIIGFGSKNQGTCKTHGSPLGEEDGEFAKHSYGFDFPKFTLDQKVVDNFRNQFNERNNACYQNYLKELNNLKDKNKELYKDFIDSIKNDYDYNTDDYDYNKVVSEATRKTSQNILNYYLPKVKNLIGGSADVANSVMTNVTCTKQVPFDSLNRNGNNINWGIREFLMIAASNGMVLHGGVKTYCGSFLMFSDYARSAIRMAAYMKIPQILLLSHDSLAVGEDGPSHQPIEHLASLRALPNLNVLRPCDVKETLASWKIALESKETPTAIILSRQNLPVLSNTDISKCEKGAYIVSDSINKEPNLIIVASGSEVSLAFDVKEKLRDENIRIVSMFSMELFDKQSKAYKDKILGTCKCKVLSLEMASTFGWSKYAKYNYGIDEFGASGKPEDVFKKFKFTVNDVVKYIKKIG